MAFIRSIEHISTKWATVTPMRTADYAAGIADPRRSWSAATKAAESAYEEGVKASILAKTFGKGVAKAGDEKWQRKATVNGVQRWGPGVTEAKGDYAAGFTPYQAAISAVVLPPRYARRDPRNLARVKAVVDALIAKKLSIMGK
ncbi:MAG TPA: hypothetical protein ENH62_14490 [Marinobacter sp.]|nr:hypothetical protein [Marinobacter sp.]